MLMAPTDRGALMIRPARPRDFAGIWAIFRAVIAGGDTYA
jgi:hypothetical protein